MCICGLGKDSGIAWNRKKRRILDALDQKGIPLALLSKPPYPTAPMFDSREKCTLLKTSKEGVYFLLCLQIDWTPQWRQLDKGL